MEVHHLSALGKGCVVAALIWGSTWHTQAARRPQPARTGEVILTCRSLAGYGSEKFGRRFAFSTPDNQPGLPLHTVGTNGQIFLGKELAPVTNQPGLFRTEVIAVPSNVDPANIQPENVLAIASMNFLFPTNDVDTNGVADFMQLNRGFDGLVVGSTTVDSSPGGLTFYPTFDGFVTGGGQFEAAAFEFNVVNDDDQHLGFDMEGTFEFLHTTGSVTNRGRRLLFALAATNGLGHFTYTGKAAARVRGDELRLGTLTLKRSDGVKLRLPKMTLRRVNDRFIGEIEFNDGYLATPWPDYRRWAIEIKDFTATPQ
jgi:hypothetical protein